MKKCAFCAEEIQDEAIICKHCGANLQTMTPGAKSVNPASTQGMVAALAGGTLIAGGSALPWASITSGLTGTVSLTGLDSPDGGTGDGIVTLAIGIAILAAATLLARRSPSATGLLCLIGGAIAGFLAYVKIADVKSIAGGSPSEFVIVTVGIGLWVILGGAVLAILGGIVMGYKKKVTAPAPAGSAEF